ncbi:MAG TPA: ATP-binding protein, partial [Polyangiaceae bacterium]|nr:ATP-binding protein [Polyangiaceae bacterium]
AMKRVRSVASRILLSYAVVLVLFGSASAWSVWTFRTAVREAELLRSGYLPLALSVRELVANQDTWNTQLNHVTTAGNPSDIRVWFETALAIGRPKKLAEVRSALARVFADEPNAPARREIMAELERVTHLGAEDQTTVSQLFDALARDDGARALLLRDELVRRGLRVQRGFFHLEQRITAYVDGIVDAARVRERTAQGLLVSFGLSTLLIGLLMALYSRRVVAPVALVTQRARAVASGDLRPGEVISSRDELGELSATFESMVQAIGEARERLLAAERLAAIGKMAAHVTHEVRNPLSSMALNLDLLGDELAPSQTEALTLLRAIGREVQRLSALSDQYLSMAGRKAPEFEACDVGELVRGSVEFMRREVERTGVGLSLELEPGLPWLEVDPNQLRQALFNLLRNAREALSDGGRVVVKVTRRDDTVSIEVEDDGPGVPESVIERLFDPFFTTKEHGTGLGLGLSREIVVAHGGALEYRPRPGGGSSFLLHLPVPSALGRSGLESES